MIDHRWWRWEDFPNPEGSQTIGADPVRFAQALLGDVVFVRLLIYTMTY
jgi:hypothetical protein